MLDIDMINATIEELEQERMSFDTCEKLATLYICRDNVKNTLKSAVRTPDSVLGELQEILPSYYKYVDTKKRYQQFEVVDKMLIYAMQNLCDEITDFVGELYHNTETDGERALIIEMITNMRSAI